MAICHDDCMEPPCPKEVYLQIPIARWSTTAFMSCLCNFFEHLVGHHDTGCQTRWTSTLIQQGSSSGKVLQGGDPSYLHKYSAILNSVTSLSLRGLSLGSCLCQYVLEWYQMKVLLLCLGFFRGEKQTNPQSIMLCREGGLCRAWPAREHFAASRNLMHPLRWTAIL